MNIGYSTEKTKVTASPSVAYSGKPVTPKPLPITEKYSVFHVEGGLGKNVAATTIVRLIKQKHPDRKLIVVASWPEVFLNNPLIHRAYRVGHTPYFYDDFILDKDVIVFRHEPYFQTDHILKRKHLIQNWAELYNLDYTDGMQPELYPNMVQDMTSVAWNRPKPILLLHTNGGAMQHQRYTYSWTRDMPAVVGQQIVNKYADKYHIIQVCRLPEQALPGVEVVNAEMSNMELFTLLRMSAKRVLIDSCLQHAAAAFNLKSTVLWVGTSPTVFGYKLHSNISATIPKDTVKLVDSYLFDYQFDGILHECPFRDMNSMFDIKQVFTSIDKT